MDEVVRAYYHDYKRVIIAMLLVSGMWPDDSKQSRVFRTSLTLFSLILITTLILGIMSFTIQNSSHIMVLVGGCGAIISFGWICIKMVTMMLLWRDVKNLNGGLTALFESDLKVPENRVHLLSYYRVFYRFFRVYYFYCLSLTALSACMPICLLPFVDITSGLIRYECHSLTLQKIQLNNLACLQGGPLHWMIFTFEIGTTAIMSINSIGVDTVFGLFTLHMVGELRLLSHRFRSLTPGQYYKRELKDCIDRHCLLIDYKYMIDKVFGFMSIWLALSCAVIICSFIFQVTQSDNVPVLKVFFAVDYIVAKFLQAYTYAWFGNTITVESERCVDSIYHSEWVESGDLRIMKDILIVRSQSPMQINAMGVMIVRLDMFIKIAHASISYFFLLKTIEEKLT